MALAALRTSRLGTALRAGTDLAVSLPHFCGHIPCGILAFRHWRHCSHRSDCSGWALPTTLLPMPSKIMAGACSDFPLRASAHSVYPIQYSAQLYYKEQILQVAGRQCNYAPMVVCEGRISISHVPEMHASSFAPFVWSSYSYRTIFEKSISGNTAMRRSYSSLVISS